LDTPVLESNHVIDAGSWIFQNSSLTIEDVLKAPTWESLEASVQAIFDEYPVTAFNKAFDFGFLRARGIEIKCEVECIMLAATPICQIPKPWDDENDPYKWPTATEAYTHFYPDEKYVEAHRAYDDCVHEAKVLYAMIK
jgi:DNA polymerase-3 subunit epsilon